jgi:hypothetical protein
MLTKRMITCDGPNTAATPTAAEPSPMAVSNGTIWARIAISRKPVSAKPQVTRCIARDQSSCGRLPPSVSIATGLVERAAVA